MKNVYKLNYLRLKNIFLTFRTTEVTKIELSKNKHLYLMKRSSLILLSLIFSIQLAFGQNYTQTVRGRVLDNQTLTPLQDIYVEISVKSKDYQDSNSLTDENGEFSFAEVPTGTVTLFFAGTEHHAYIKEDIKVFSARETVLDIYLKPNAVNLEVIEISANTFKGEALNTMAINSAVTITPEETDKFAGSWNDPMRVITSYPSAVQQSSGFNNFTIRGNSPIGMMYRIEGAPVHNPNHFAMIGSSGGFVTQFSSSVLSTSDFFSSAFPAEFGNATSAVFDFRFRNGNNQKREHSFKAGLLGLDIATEGPFKKNGKASYLINYRYSTLGLLSKVIRIGVEPQYQDLSFNANIPIGNKGGLIKVFGIGGLSDYLLKAERDSTQWDEEARRIERSFGSNAAAAGISYYQPVNAKGFCHTVLSSSTGQYFDNSLNIEDDLSEQQRQISEFDDTRINLTTDYNYQINRRHFNKTGVSITQQNHRYAGALYDQSMKDLDTLGNTEGKTYFFQAYSQSKFEFNDKVKLTAGIHYLHFLLNNANSLDPRLGLSYEPNPSTKIGLAYGHHSRIENQSLYYLRNEDGLINRDLGLYKSHHAALSFVKMLSPNLKFSSELYYQFHYDVPAESGGTYSTQNLFSLLPTGNLANVGNGRNYGIEFLLQRSSKKGIYYMISGTLFDTKYQAGDGVWRNAEFNQNYSYNILAGKTFDLKPKKTKSRQLSLNANFRHSGGTWATPIDLEASRAYGWTRLDTSKPHSLRRAPLYNLDFSLTHTINKENTSSEFSIKIKNLTSSESVISEFYDIRIDEIKQVTDYGVIPVITYELHF